MHGEQNYPFRRTPSDLDVGLPDQTGDHAYAEALRCYLPEALSRARPDLVFYLGGVDVFDGDRFGRLALTRGGIETRDRTVIDMIRNHDLALTLLLSGGYASTPELTADLHAITHRAASAHVSGA